MYSCSRGLRTSTSSWRPASGTTRHAPALVTGFGSAPQRSTWPSGSSTENSYAQLKSCSGVRICAPLAANSANKASASLRRSRARCRPDLLVLTQHDRLVILRHRDHLARVVLIQGKAKLFDLVAPTNLNILDPHYQ